MHPHVGKARPVSFLVPFRIAPETARHADPGLAQHQFAHRPAQGPALIIHDVRRHAGQRAGEGARFERRQDVAGKNAAGSLRAAGVIDDRQPSAADGVKEPQPGVGVPRFTGRTELAQR